MNKNRNLLTFCLLTVFLCGFTNKPLVEVRNYLTPTELYKTYTPILQEISPAPPETISHYISWTEDEMTDENFYDMGQYQGEIVQSGWTGYIILHFGDPAIVDEQYNVYGTNFLGRDTSVDQIFELVTWYVAGFYTNSPEGIKLELVIGTSNYGGQVTEQHGQAWGLLIHALDDWLTGNPDFPESNWHDKVDIRGGIDNELGWNNSTVSLSWRDAFIIETSLQYVYYGTCDSCTWEEHAWDPCQIGWCQFDIYDMASPIHAILIPQIYLSIEENGQWYGVNESQWYYESLYTRLNHFNPVLHFAGTLTQYNACLEPEGGNCVGDDWRSDNTPQDGWSRLYNVINTDPRTTQENIPFSTDISWHPMKVETP